MPDRPIRRNSARLVIAREFLPDVARRIHVRVIFAQRILNQVSSDDFDAH